MQGATDQPTPVVGRDAELSAVDDFLDGLAGGARALVIRGDAGIGKTTIWREGIRRAEARSYRVLRCGPAEAEARLSFAALGDLLEPVLDDVRAALPAPQRRALEVALLRRDASARPPDRRTTAVAALTALRTLASEQTTLVAVDDVQWLDTPSARVLEFVLRRLNAEPIGLLATVRADPDAPLTIGADRSLPDDRTRNVSLEPLSLGALHHLVRERTGLSPSRPTMRRVREASGGNPFYALEIARALSRTGIPAPGDPLPVPKSLRALVRTRLSDLPASARTTLLAAAALSQPTVDLLLVAGSRQARRDLDRAAAAGVVEIDGGRVRFTHPLLASAIYAEAATTHREAVHRCLAAVVREPEERARHRALASAAPNERVASELEAVAELAATRGAPDSAAELAELASRFTPPRRSEAMRRRDLRKGRFLFMAGDSSRARQLLEELVERSPPSAERARALLALADILFEVEGSVPAVERCEQALADAATHRLLTAEIHASIAGLCDHDVSRKGSHARRALALLRPGDDPGLEALALHAFAHAESASGRPCPVDALERAIALERTAPPLRARDRAIVTRATELRRIGRLAAARDDLGAAYRSALDEGDDSSLPWLAGWLSQLELVAGNWAAAQRHAEEALAVAAQIEHGNCAGWARVQLANVHAHRGRTGAPAPAHSRASKRLRRPTSRSWPRGAATSSASWSSPSATSRRPTRTSRAPPSPSIASASTGSPTPVA